MSKRKNALEIIARLPIGEATIHAIPPDQIGKIDAPRRQQLLRQATGHFGEQFAKMGHKLGRWSYAGGEARAVCRKCKAIHIVAMTVNPAAVILAHCCLSGLLDCVDRGTLIEQTRKRL